MYAIIPAGGSGTRLWPMSRSKYPKHLLNLSGDATMIQQTLMRIRELVDDRHVFIVTEAGHADELKKQLPQLPTSHVLIEPARRDTAAVIGLGTLKVESKEHDAVVASLHSDHLITKPHAFLNILKTAEKLAAQHDVIVTLGIHPTYPATSMGYIASGDEIQSPNSHKVFKVKRFAEKPDLPTAQAFLASGGYFWNAGMFIARTSVLMKAFEKHAPHIYTGLLEIQKHIGQPNEKQMIDELYAQLPKEPIDTAIMEKSDNIVVIPSDIGWNDVGSWNILKEVLPNDHHHNLVQGEHVGVDTRNCLIYGHKNRLIGTIGLENMVIVDSEDALLICPIDQVEKVKELVKRIKQEKEDQYL